MSSLKKTPLKWDQTLCLVSLLREFAGKSNDKYQALDVPGV